MKVELISYTENPIETVERAARTCYNSAEKQKGLLLRTCFHSGHGSVMEFADFTFKISGISRACANQLVRHRVASYAQQSQRYVNESNANYVVPKNIKNHESKEVIHAYENVMNTIMATYDYLIENGVRKEDARFVLPNAIETTITVKMNLRSLANFMNERLSLRSQWEIRELAEKMRDKVLEIEPGLDYILVSK